MKLSSVAFDLEGDVSLVTMTVEDLHELVFITDTMGPEGLVFPVQLRYNAEDVAALFHRCGAIPGTSLEYEVSSGIFEALASIVDRYIEYESA